MTIIQIKGNKVLVDMSGMLIWLNKETLHQYGINIKELKVGMVLSSEIMGVKS